MNIDPDINVIDAVLDGNDDAFDDIVIKYQRAITSLIIRITGNYDESPDIAQQVFIKAYTKLGSFRRKSTFKTWLFSIAINFARNELRQKIKRSRTEDVDELNLGVESKVEGELINGQHKSQLANSLHLLPHRQRSVLVLRIYEEMSFREIGLALEMSENSAKVNYHHAVNKLRDLLGSDSHGGNGRKP